MHSATIAFIGGSGGGSPVEEILQNLIRRAIVDGVATAAQAFDECTTSASCFYHEFFMLHGLRVEKPMEVFDGVWLIPLPDSAIWSVQNGPTEIGIGPAP